MGLGVSDDVHRGSGGGRNGLVPQDVLDTTFQTGVAARLAEFPYAAEAESEFWEGFVHGFELSSSRTWRGSPKRTDWGAADFDAPIRR